MSKRFLSTPSVRRATACRWCRWSHLPISIHALREEGDDVPGVEAKDAWDISIHALREEGDGRVPFCFPCRKISIHALREEGDCRGFFLSSRQKYFYPRPP